MLFVKNALIPKYFPEFSLFSHQLNMGVGGNIKGAFDEAVGDTL